MSLGDLDELVLSCRTDEARSYVSEAVACYKAGAYRACIVATWIAVVYDLLAKIRELALASDAEAQRIVGDLTNWHPLIARGDQVAIRKSLDMERNIVNVVNETFGFFDGLQIVDLNRLRDDRNRCGHPTYQSSDKPYAPSAELARTHLVHAVHHVLSQAPVQGKAATAHIMRIVESSYFPIDVEQAKVQLRSAGLDRPRESLVKSVADHLVFGMLEGDSRLKGRKQTAVALRATYELFPGWCEPRIRRALNTVGRRAPDKDLPYFVGLQNFLPHTWGFLEQDNQTRIDAMIRQSTDEYAKSFLPICLDIAELADACGSRARALSFRDLGVLLNTSKHPILISRAVDLYCSSKNWDQANSYYRYVMEPILNELNGEQLRRILVAKTEEHADLNGAHSFSMFTRYIYDNEKLPRPEIIDALTQQQMSYIVESLKTDTISF